VTAEGGIPTSPPEPARHFPHFTVDLEPASVDVAAILFPEPLQVEIGIGERNRRKHHQVTVLGILKALHLQSGVDHGVGPGDERFLVQADPLVVEHPHAVPLVGTDHEDGVLHWSTLPRLVLPIIRQATWNDSGIELCICPTLWCGSQAIVPNIAPSESAAV